MKRGACFVFRGAWCQKRNTEHAIRNTLPVTLFPASISKSYGAATLL